ncbi:hypothetical protein J1605_005659 [Eschrichtius robustus]|uniref:Uncharacterized protein n=1 Tax=Eschrichtius robustus TaxID=9764 RepID=A0AB34HA89_ESCRO|nr:hypothetical protein J1605_005659 [Eschrichtius robustus]
MIQNGRDVQKSQRARTFDRHPFMEGALPPPLNSGTRPWGPAGCNLCWTSVQVEEAELQVRTHARGAVAEALLPGPAASDTQAPVEQGPTWLALSQHHSWDGAAPGVLLASLQPGLSTGRAKGERVRRAGWGPSLGRAV